MNVLIFGSGGTAKEVIGYIESDNSYRIAGIVSTERFNNPDFKFPVYDKAPDMDALYVLAVAEPWVKRKIVAENKDRWITYAHSSVHLSPYAKIGRGCLFLANSCISGDAVIGDFCTYNIYSQSGHDCVIGAYSTFSPYAQTCGGCVLGEDVFLGVRAVCVPNVRMASGSKASAGAVVRKSVLEPVTVYGDPARTLLS